MITDYWLDEAGDYVGGDGAFLPYRMLEAYSAEPPHGTELTEQEATMAGLFELRLTLDFESYRALCAPPGDVNPGPLCARVKHGPHGHGGPQVWRDVLGVL